MTAEPDDTRAPQAAAPAAALYGVLIALGFASVAWGIDAVLLSTVHAAFAWHKMLVGLPLALLVGIICGVLAHMWHPAIASLLTWMAGGAALGAIGGALPFLGQDLVAWVLKPSLLGTSLYPFDALGLPRLLYTTFVLACWGVAVGQLAHALLSRRPFRLALLLWGLPLALLAGLATDDLVNRRLRVGLRETSQALKATEAEAVETGYTLHLVSYDLATRSTETIDAVFPVEERAVRCRALGDSVGACPPLSPRLHLWMEALLQRVLDEETSEALPAFPDGFAGSEQAVLWLEARRSLLDEPYTIQRHRQLAGWITMEARFTNGSLLRCTFRGADPIVVERCAFEDR
jgi:hypothetical protein